MRLRDQETDTTAARSGRRSRPTSSSSSVFAIAKLVDPVEQFLFELGGGTGFGTDEKTPTASPGRASTSITPDGEPPSAATFQFSFWDTPGTVVLFCGLLTIARAADQPRATRCATLRRDARPAQVGDRSPSWPSSALAYVMNLTGMTTTLGRWVAGVRRAASRSCHRSSAGSASRSRARTRRRTRCSARCRWRRRRRPAINDVLLASANSLRRRARQDDLAAEPRDRRRRGGPGRQGGRHLPAGSCSGASRLALVMCVIVYLQSTAILDWMVVEAK